MAQTGPQHSSNSGRKPQQGRQASSTRPVASLPTDCPPHGGVASSPSDTSALPNSPSASSSVPSTAVPYTLVHTAGLILAASPAVPPHVPPQSKASGVQGKHGIHPLPNPLPAESKQPPAPPRLSAKRVPQDDHESEEPPKKRARQEGRKRNLSSRGKPRHTSSEDPDGNSTQDKAEQLRERMKVLLGPHEQDSTKIVPCGLLSAQGDRAIIAADHSKFGRVAVKVLDLHEWVRYPDVYDKMRLEQIALRRITENTVDTNTRYLVPLLHSWTDESYLYMTTPLYNCTLRHHLMQVKQLPASDVKFYLSQLVCGLASLHRLGIVHHDIKSSNIFMTQLGDVAIGDFGLASIETSHLSESTSYSRGTYGYMAPEILFRDRNEAPSITEFNPISDIWSLGIVLLEMSLGRQEGQDIIDSLQEKADTAAETGQVTLDQFHEYIEKMLQNLVLTASMDKAQWIVLKMMLQFSPFKRITVWELLFATIYLGNVEQELAKSYRPTVLPRWKGFKSLEDILDSAEEVPITTTRSRSEVAECRKKYLNLDLGHLHYLRE